MTILNSHLPAKSTEDSAAAAHRDALAHADQAAAKAIPINYSNTATWRTLDGTVHPIADLTPEHRANILIMLERMASTPARRAAYIMVMVNTLVNAEVRPGEAVAITEQLIRVNSLLALHNTPLARKLVELNAA
jgi:hypothetical protein